VHQRGQPRVGKTLAFELAQARAVERGEALLLDLALEALGTPAGSAERRLVEVGAANSSRQPALLPSGRRRAARARDS